MRFWPRARVARSALQRVVPASAPHSARALLRSGQLGAAVAGSGKCRGIAFARLMRLAFCAGAGGPACSSNCGALSASAPLSASRPAGLSCVGSLGRPLRELAGKCSGVAFFCAFCAPCAFHVSCRFLAIALSMGMLAWGCSEGRAARGCARGRSSPLAHGLPARLNWATGGCQQAL